MADYVPTSTTGNAPFGLVGWGMDDIERIARILNSIDFPPEDGFDFDNADFIINQRWYRQRAAALIKGGFDIVARATNDSSRHEPT